MVYKSKIAIYAHLCKVSIDFLCLPIPFLSPLPLELPTGAPGGPSLQNRSERHQLPIKKLPFTAHETKIRDGGVLFRGGKPITGCRKSVFHP